MSVDKNSAMPDFVFIGAPRAGSTWLHAVLRTHKQVWLPPLKNLLYAHPQAWVNKARILRQIGRGLIPIKWSDLLWFGRFFTGNPTAPNWYRSLFPPDNTQVRGDISEDLLVLDDAAIARYAAINPKLKIIFIMRDPVERIYSHIKHNFVNNRGLDFTAVPLGDYAAMLTSDWALARSRYAASLQRWQVYFPPEQILLADYAALNANPDALLERICAFLGISDSKEAFINPPQGRINASQETDLPVAVIKTIWPLLADDVRLLGSEFAPAQSWYDHYTKILADTPPHQAPLD